MITYTVTNGVPTEVVEVCANCLRAPQAPSWDQCYGCGLVGTRRIHVPADECVETGTTSSSGYRPFWICAECYDEVQQ
jgi:hypothetical protein